MKKNAQEETQTLHARWL